ncbi:hypothetical protein ACHAXN_007971 [Cyclotella atomus]
MNEHLASEHVQIPGDWEYDGDTGNIVCPDLFSDDEPSTIDHREMIPSADNSLSLDTEDGGFTTITTLLAEGIRSKSTFEVVEIEASSNCASESLQSATNLTSGSGEAALVSSDNSPSFPDGAIVDHPFDEYHQVKARCSDPSNRHPTIVQNEDQDQSVDDESTTLSSLTNNESMFLRWLNPKDRVGMLFDPFRDAMRPPLFEQNNIPSREISGFNRIIVASARNLSSIFRPRPHPEFHFNRPQTAPAISTSSTPENLVITTTHSVTPSLCTSASDNRVASFPSSTQSHGVSQLFNNEVRERYGAAVRSYQLKHPPVALTPPSPDENNKRKRCRLLIMVTCFALMFVAVSIAVAATRKSSNASDEQESNLADKHRQGDGSLPSACCVDDMQSLDQVPVNVDAETSIYEHVEIALPAAGNSTGSSETVEPVDVVVFASSQNEPQPSPTPPTPIASHVATPHVASIDAVSIDAVVLESIEDITEISGSKTEAPTSTISPTRADTIISVVLPQEPIDLLTPIPTEQLTKEPSKKPTHRPTRIKTRRPSNKPTPHPTLKPSIRDIQSIPATSTDRPIYSPSLSPIRFPTFMPSTLEPSINPTKRPSDYPIMHEPSYTPSGSPVTSESEHPSDSPITDNPSKHPSEFPVTTEPTDYPSPNPSKQPSEFPATAEPTDFPSHRPVNPPVLDPTYKPTLDPITPPPSNPTPYPTQEPTEYVTTECTDRKFTYNNEGCTNDSAGGDYELFDCCDEFYGSFDSCVFVDVCGIYTHQPSLKPTLIETMSPLEPTPRPQDDSM